jgi:hypothetical protein
MRVWVDNYEVWNIYIEVHRDCTFVINELNQPLKVCARNNYEFMFSHRFVIFPHQSEENKVDIQNM